MTITLGYAMLPNPTGSREDWVQELIFLISCEPSAVYRPAAHPQLRVSLQGARRGREDLKYVHKTEVVPPTVKAATPAVGWNIAIGVGFVAEQNSKDLLTYRDALLTTFGNVGISECRE